MGYDLHIVRTREWLDADADPILKQDVDALIEADAELSWSKSDYVELNNPSTGETIRFRSSAIEWNGMSQFWWYGNRISSKAPSDDQQKKMIKMARTLNAMVIGDEGERYDLRKRWFGREEVVVIPWTEPAQASTAITS